MALTDDEIRDLALRILTQTAEMIEGKVDQDNVKFRISPDGATASLLIQTYPRKDGGRHMALMLAVSERVRPISDAKDQFVAWVDRQ